MKVSATRLRETLEAMARIGATPAGGVTRLALTDEDRAGRDQFTRWMQEADLEVSVDDLGNMYGRRVGTDTVADPVLLGSHLDSVIQGGRFDGVLGVLAGLEVMRTLNDHAFRTTRSLELVNWTNEEGLRFQPGMLGSGAAVGRHTRDFAYGQVDDTGRAFGDELRRIGYLGDKRARMNRAAGYLELHIEQGPVLEEIGADIGVVEGIQGITWWRWRVSGQAGHAGTAPMPRRRDALVAASECVLGLNELPSRLGGGLVTTVGVMNVRPGGINIIPDTVEFTLDMRAPATTTLEAGRGALSELAARVRARGLAVAYEEVAYSAPTRFAPHVVSIVEAAARKSGLRTHRMFSGAGHDAMHLADVAPAAMIFVPCRDGLSHAEAEYITWEAAAQGAQVLLDAVLALAA